MVLVAYILGPPIALANSYGAGLTDQDNGANYATLALFLFAAWGGSTGNGIIAGCALMGVVMVCAVTASVLMQVGNLAAVVSGTACTACDAKLPCACCLSSGVSGTAISHM